MTTNAQHTPGKWVLREASPVWEIFSEDLSRWVAYAPKAVSDDARIGTFYPTLAETEANARLIAAAPELLRVAEMVVEASDLARFSGPLGDAARAAILKATGEPK